MARNKRKTKKSPIFITISIITLILLLTLITNTIIKINKYLNINKALEVKIAQTKNNNNDELKKQESLIENLDEIKNIDTTINNTKNEIFTLAKELENKIIKKESKYKIAYITFDDGPYYSTDKVLSILKKYNVKATFFTIGLDKDICYDNKNHSCKETYKKIVDAGHTIANHTYSHAIFRGLYASSTSFLNEVKKQETLIKDRTGVTTNIIRFPGGINTARALAKNSVNTILEELKKNHYGWIDWTAQDGDGGYLPSTTTAWNNFTNTIDEDIEVILFHDYSTVTISILPKAIEYLEEKNYILLPLFYDSVKVNK